MKTMRRNGFSLIEVMVSLVILTVAILGIQGVAGNMLGMLGTSERRALAMRLAEDRIGQIRLEQVYTNIGSYAGTENPVTGWPGFKRITTVQQLRDSTALGITDYKKVAVTVSAPGIVKPIFRSITRGAP